MDHEAEEWRDVPGFEGLYQVSDLGRVRSLDRITPAGPGGVGRAIRRGKILSPKVRPDGYLHAVLCEGGAKRYLLVSRMVASAWHGAPPTVKHEAAHGALGKKVNTPQNLRWATREENERDKIRDGTLRTGESHQWAKLTAAQVAEIRKARPYKTLKVLGFEYGVHFSTISALCCGVSWKH